jgi:fermentation-respiration switch protein FrsA (DUF1100 family)
VLACLKAVGRFALRHWPTTVLVGGILLLAMTTNILERFFVYYPMKEIVADPSRIGLPYEDVRAVAGDGVKVHGWFVPHPGARFTFLIFHGNAGNISHRLGWIQMLHSLDAHVMIIDYRGYGLSEGKPFEKGLYLDALAAYAWWSHERAEDHSRLILVGESLGGAVAVDLASRVPVDGIVLQSTFTSAWDMAKTIIPIGLLQPLTGVRFDSAAKIRTVSCPKLFIHGSRDEIVPFRLGRRLYELALPPKEFYEVSGAGHNDLIIVAGAEYPERLRTFLSTLR